MTFSIGHKSLDDYARFTAQEVSKIKHTTTGITLLGFKDVSLLPKKWTIGIPFFVVPDEASIAGSTFLLSNRNMIINI